MALEEPEKPKWGGQTSAKLKGSKEQEVWPLLADFCNMDKWFPGLHTCYQVGGVPGQPGLVRYCERGTDETTILWAKEKLLMIDPINQCMTYEIVDNNMGFESYVATMQLVPINNHGCKIEW
ncbi:putative polyketide cyclase/dehydrase, START-like domain-containing protein [Rosa chinensis]|uniref:Putative polyketide cyclase/dehydrase, START-like domain-containing protein n=1 Tax=Rosa chinensis TaxID=74649 RepID=A0A2P6PDN5_ROSCH|nr:putative polyketide cyclase/dehydrase, START-like domain-containing protein [Rosa chinensis]